MKFSELYNQKWNNTPLKKRFLKQDKKVQNKDGEYLLNVSSMEGKNQLKEKADQFLNPERIRKELERFVPPRSLSNYEYLVLKYGILKFLCKSPGYSEEEDELIRYVREKWEREIIEEYKEETKEFADDELFKLARAASDYEDEILKGELNLIHRYLKEYNSEKDHENEKLWWGDFFIRLCAIKKFPKLSEAKIHGNRKVQKAVRALEDQAILYEIKGEHGEKIIGIPEEFVPEIKKWLHFELSKNKFKKLLREIDEFKRGTLNTVMKTCDLGSASGNEARIKEIAGSKVLPSEALEIGLDREDLKNIVDRYQVNISKRKSSQEIAEAIVQSFLDWGREDEELEWENPQYLEYFEELSSLEPITHPFTDRLKGDLKKRDLKNIYDKEFEIATYEILKNVLSVQEVELLGHTDSRVPDGRIEWGDDVILWDNKASGEKYHMGAGDERAMKEYVEQEDHNVELFMFISSGFSQSTHGKVDTKFNSKKDFETSICLVKAEDFKELAQYWRDYILVENPDSKFPLSAFLQEGLLDLEKAKSRL